MSLPLCFHKSYPMNKTILFLILSLCIFCIQCTTNRPALKLVPAGQGSLVLNYDTIQKGPTRLFGLPGDTTTVMLYYLCSADSTVKRRRLSDGSVTALYKLQGSEYGDMSQVVDKGDTAFLFLASADIIAVAPGWHRKYRLPKMAGKTYLFRVDDLNVHQGKVFIQYSVATPPNFIDKYVDVVLPLYDTTDAALRYCGAYPDIYRKGVFYYTNASRTFTGNALYYLFEKSDSLQVYDPGTLEPVAAIPVFTDISRDAADRPYDAARARDFVYLKEYVTIAEYNARIFQTQTGNQLYMIKRLPAEDAAAPMRYVVGKVRDNRYIGYAELPADFDAWCHFFYNNTLYYISTRDKAWYQYSIEEI